ncbi:HTH-type transcriptional regulator DmlR [Burkholderia cenocepacia]|nr:HTH-type transcriptional regulator DmlR [Burkholderia cenocepacia]
MLNRLDILKIFSAAAAAPTFREAAARLGVSPQVVTRAVRELEEMLGETLFHRTTRSIRITAFGQSFAREVQGALAVVDGLFGPATGQRDEPVGVVRITAPSGMGRHYVQPVLTGLMQRYPGLVPDLRLSDVPSPVVDEQIDIGVRVGAIGDNRFVARMVGPLPMWVVAAPSLIRRLGEPKNRKALEAMPVTCLIDRASGRPWPWMFRGEQQFVPSSPAYLTDDTEVEIEAVCAGWESASVRNIWCGRTSGRGASCGCCRASSPSRGSCTSIGRGAGRCRVVSGWCTTNWWRSSRRRRGGSRGRRTTANVGRGSIMNLSVPDPTPDEFQLFGNLGPA